MRSAKLATKRPAFAVYWPKSTASAPGCLCLTAKMTTSTESETAWPSWVYAPARLTGRQEPADTSWFEGDESDGDRAARLGARVGLKPFPQQWEALRKILSRRADGLWVHPDGLLVETRQSGKSAILILRILFGLYILNESAVYSAQRWVTAESIFKRLKAIIESRPSLQRRLAREPSVASSRAVIELRSGASVAFGVRSGDLGRGLDKLDLVVFDEAYNLTDAEVSALTGAQLASPNAQTIYASTPPVLELHPDCRVLADMRRLGQRRAPDLYFAEWGAPAAMSRDDPQAWRLASPSYGVIQKERDVARMHAKAQTPSAKALFDADVLGWGSWPVDESEREPLIGPEIWAAMACGDEPPELTGAVAMALDRSPDRSTWALAAARRTVDGRVHVEIGYNQAATNTEALEYVLKALAALDPVSLTIDARSPAAAIAPYLVSAGVEPTTTNTADLAAACGGFLDEATQGRLSHTGQQVLADAVASAAKRDLPAGGFAWSRQAGGQLAQLNAATLAHYGLLVAPVVSRPPPEPLADTPHRGRHEDNLDRALGPGELPVMTMPF
jgi:hypothetical protein